MPVEQPGNQPTRLAHLDHGNDRAILVQGDEGPAQVVRLGHRGTPSVTRSDEVAISLYRRPNYRVHRSHSAGIRNPARKQSSNRSNQTGKIDPLSKSALTPIHFTFRRNSRIGPLTDVSVVPIEEFCEWWLWSLKTM